MIWLGSPVRAGGAPGRRQPRARSTSASRPSTHVPDLEREPPAGPLPAGAEHRGLLPVGRGRRLAACRQKADPGVRTSRAQQAARQWARPGGAVDRRRPAGAATRRVAAVQRPTRFGVGACSRPRTDQTRRRERRPAAVPDPAVPPKATDSPRVAEVVPVPVVVHLVDVHGVGEERDDERDGVMNPCQNRARIRPPWSGAAPGSGRPRSRRPAAPPGRAGRPARRGTGSWAPPPASQAGRRRAAQERGPGRGGLGPFSRPAAQVDNGPAAAASSVSGVDQTGHAVASEGRGERRLVRGARASSQVRVPPTSDRWTTTLRPSAGSGSR